MQFQIKYIFLVLVTWFCATLQAQTPQSLYYDAYSQIESMLSEKDSLDFKEAVFLTDRVLILNHFAKNILIYSGIFENNFIHLYQL